MISEPDRRKTIELIETARRDGARLIPACQVLRISARTYQRWTKTGSVSKDRRPDAIRPVPANKLTEQEKQRILDVCHQKGNASLPPSQIVPQLADQGQYIASESSFYRILHQADEQHHRGYSQKPRKIVPPKGFCATGPNQVWTWDITWLPAAVRGMFFYLYMIVDVFSRKIVGWEVYASESADQAAEVFRKTYLREAIAGNRLVLHSDNGSPMKGATMLATLQKLGVMPSFSRPSVSDDNPYSEALFKTLKYHPGIPEKPFESLEQARRWVSEFVRWYNEIHRHSGLRFVTPGQRHRGEDGAILEQRQSLYLAAKAQRPERWSGPTRNWEPEKIVYLNPGKPAKTEVGLTQKAA